MAEVKFLKLSGSDLKQHDTTNDSLTLNNLTLNGDLTINGSATTVNTETVTIDDNILVLNNNETGTPSQDAGIEVERGTSTNVQVLWNETTDRWQAGVVGSLENIVLPTTTDTLTNKTINSASNTITITESNISDLGAYITASSTDTLTNKTINSASNTITITESNISDLQAYLLSADVGDGAKVDGDIIDIDFTPSNYTPDSSPAEAVDVDDLAAHLKGIDTALATAGAAPHKTSYTAGAGGIAAGDLVYISANDTVLKGDASGIATARVIGIAESAISATASGDITTFGLITGVGSAWTAGASVYLSETAGLLTQTAPTTSGAVVVSVGIAKNTTDLQLNIEKAVILA